MTRVEDDYEDGRLTQQLTSDRLMQMALQKYKTISNKGQWMQKSDEELEFIAMQSELKQLRQNPTKVKAKPQGGGTKKSDSSKANRNTGKFAWKGLAPKAGEPHEKTVDGKAYIYCPHHQSTKWVLKVNLQGVEHKTGCRMMAEASTDKLVAAVANLDAEDDEEEQI